jgi:hypothetical protein
LRIQRGAIVKSCQALVMLVGIVGFLAAAEKATAGDSGVLVIVDGTGKEHKVKNWHFINGVKNLSWLAPAAPQDKDKTKGKKPPTPTGPEALELVEGKGAPLKKGVLTYVPLSSVRSIEFNPAKDKETMTVRICRSDKEADDEIVVGPTGYIGINHVAITAMADLGELGQATVEFQGGVERGVRSIRFPSPKPIDPVPEGRIAVITAASKKYPTLKVTDLQPLYMQTGGLFRTLPTLYFKETVKVDIGKIAKMAQIGVGGNNFEVTLQSGQQNPLVLLDRPKGPDGKGDLLLVGLVGRFSAGYRMFPPTAIGELHFEETAKK